MSESFELDQYKDIKVKKSNALIAAKYKSSLLENQLLSIGVARAEERANGEITAEIYPGEIRQMTGDSTSNLYGENGRLKRVALAMVGHTMLIENEDGSFMALSAIPTAEYKNGVFTITFNNKIKPLLQNLTENYTLLNLETYMSFESNEAFRLYELLRKELYKMGPKGYVQYEIGLSELKCTIGLVNMSEERVQARIRESKGQIDWDEIYDIALEKSYKGSFTDFKRGVLDKAQHEIEQKSDIRFEYERKTKGKKVVGVVFYVYNNEKNQGKGMKKPYVPDAQLNLWQVKYPDLFDKYEGHNTLISKDLETFLTEADGKEDLVIRAIEAADKQPHIVNYHGWIIDYIRKDGYEAVETIDGSYERAVLVNELMAEKDRVAENPEVVNKVYLRMKKNERFSDFLKAIDMDEDEFEMVYLDPDERIKLFTDWRLGRLS